MHLDEFAFADAQLFDDAADCPFRHIRNEALDRLTALAVYCFIKHLGGADLKLEALAAHTLDQNGEVHFAAAHDLEGVGRAAVLNPKRHVLLQLVHEAVADMAAGDKLSFASGKGAVVDGERHFHRRLGNFYKGQRLHMLRIADGITDIDLFKAGKGDDIAGAGFVDRRAINARKLVNRRYFGRLGVVCVMVVAEDNLLSLFHRSLFNATHGNAAHVVVIVNRRDKSLQGSVRVALRRVDIVYNGAEQRRQISTGLRGIQTGSARPGRAEHHGTVQLLFPCVQL